MEKQRLWNEDDLQNTLNQFKQYYNNNRLHGGIQWTTPNSKFNKEKVELGKLNSIFQLENVDFL